MLSWQFHRNWPKRMLGRKTHIHTHRQEYMLTPRENMTFVSLEKQVRKRCEANHIPLPLSLAHCLLHLRGQTVFFVALPT